MIFEMSLCAHGALSIVPKSVIRVFVLWIYVAIVQRQTFIASMERKNERVKLPSYETFATPDKQS